METHFFLFMDYCREHSLGAEPASAQFTGSKAYCSLASHPSAAPARSDRRRATRTEVIVLPGVPSGVDPYSLGGSCLHARATTTRRSTLIGLNAAAAPQLRSGAGSCTSPEERLAVDPRRPSRSTRLAQRRGWRTTPWKAGLLGRSCYRSSVWLP